MRVQTRWWIFESTFLILGLVLASSSAISQPPAAKDQEKGDAFFGVIEEGTYKNDFFGLSLPIPEGFTVLDHLQTGVYTDAGADVLKDENNSLSKAIDVAAARQATLLGVMEKPAGSPGNSIIEMVVTRQQPGVTANMALAASVSTMTSTGKLKLKQSVPDASFGGLRFAGAVITGEFGSLKIDQEMYVVIRKGYSLHIALTYSTNEGRRRLLGILEKIRFSKL